MTALLDDTATDGRRLLRVALLLDAVVTGVNGIAYLVLAGPLSGLLGPGAAALRAIGGFLLLYGIVVLLLGVRGTSSRVAVGVVIAVNLLWVADSALTAAAGWLPLTPAGTGWTIAQAVVVAAFAVLQHAGLRRAGQHTSVR